MCREDIHSIVNWENRLGFLVNKVFCLPKLFYGDLVMNRLETFREGGFLSVTVHANTVTSIWQNVSAGDNKIRQYIARCIVPFIIWSKSFSWGNDGY